MGIKLIMRNLTKMKKILFLSIIVQACAFDQTIEYRIDTLLSGYMESFYKEASARNYKVDKFNLIIELKDGLSKNENAWGLSKKIGDQRIIYIDTEFYNDYTNGNHRNRIEAIVFHEMGHSIINRRHTTKQNSLMNPDNLGSGSLYEKSFGKIDSVYREQLLDELFNLK
jgi:hypothetical protein